MSSLFFSTTPYCTHGGSKLIQTNVNTINFGINSFTYHGSKTWNNPLENVKDATCLITFKKSMVNWQGPTCKYGFCLMCNMSKCKLQYHVDNSCNVRSQLIDIQVCFQIKQPCPRYEIWPHDALLCKFPSYVCKLRSCFVQFLPFSHIIFARLYISITFS